MASTYAYTIFTLCPALAMSIALQAPSPSVGDHLGGNLGTTVTGDIGTLSVANGIGVTASNVLPTAQIQTATYSGGVPPTSQSSHITSSTPGPHPPYSLVSAVPSSSITPSTSHSISGYCSRSGPLPFPTGLNSGTTSGRRVGLGHAVVGGVIGLLGALCMYM